VRAFPRRLWIASLAETTGRLGSVITASCRTGSSAMGLSRPGRWARHWRARSRGMRR